MTSRLHTRIGRTALKNPLIAAAAEHMIDEEGVRRAILAGAAAVVVKSTNESPAAKDQLQRAEYVALDANWEAVPWGREAPAHVTLATRSGLTPQPFDAWLEQSLRLDRLARQEDCLLVASLILAELDSAKTMARKVEEAGLRVLEFNIGTPYAKEAAKGAVSTELSPERVRLIVSTIRDTVSLPLWIKITGQSERVPELAEAAFAAGADSVVMAGRLLGLIPSLETLEPMLGTSLGIGGFWNLPLTCHWLALTRAKLGKDRPLIGINGARDGFDMARMMLAGASAVGFASTIMLRGFEVITQSLAELDTYLAGKSLTAQDLIGHAADRRKSFAEMPLRTDHWRNFVPK
ncbi:dihydroorotate dehydrogenase (NAD+) catalytic subunit [Rhizobiales bacterium GAS113]|nr:dihydroorotate dehydrogenase (NAD+) catalytic subunit [Rhizobiales bacterium GAS113]